MSTRKGTTWRDVEAALEAVTDVWYEVGMHRESFERADNLTQKLAKAIRAYAKAQARKALTRRGK